MLGGALERADDVVASVASAVASSSIGGAARSDDGITLIEEGREDAGAGVSEVRDPGRGLDTEGLRKTGLAPVPAAVLVDGCPAVMLVRVAGELCVFAITDDGAVNA
jgi:hypothetical protein